MFSLTARTLPAASLLLVLLSASAPAQRDNDQSLPGTTLEIAGQVRSADGRSATANALVRLERHTGSLVDQVMTDSTGKFRFARLAPGPYVVSVKTEGFATTSSQLDINRLIPRQYVLLQLQPVGETFRKPRLSATTVDANVPAGAQAELEKARAALQAKKPEEAVTHLERALGLYPDFFEAQMILGVTRIELRQWDRAEHDFRRALEINPKASVAFVSLGEVYRRQKRYTEAERRLVAGLKLDRGSWQGHFTLGRVYWEMNEVLKAAPHVGQALELKPDYPEGRLLAGNIFMRLNMPEKALIEYEEYLRLAPTGEFARLTQENVKKLKATLPARKNN